MEIQIRRMKETEYPLLEKFLYNAIFIPDGVEAPPYDIIYRPELRVYTEGFGSSPHDHAYCAVLDGEVIGAAWVRIMDDYGHIDDDTPSLAVSLLKECRGQGIGTRLMRALLDDLAQSGYSKVSLAVQKANYAVRMYKKLGFAVTGENDEEYIMVYSC